jgi:hypothetical protein
MVANVVDEPLRQQRVSINAMTQQTASCIQPEYSPVGKLHIFTHISYNLATVIIAHNK